MTRAYAMAFLAFIAGVAVGYAVWGTSATATRAHGRLDTREVPTRRERSQDSVDSDAALPRNAKHEAMKRDAGATGLSTVDWRTQLSVVRFMADHARSKTSPIQNPPQMKAMAAAMADLSPAHAEFETDKIRGVFSQPRVQARLLAAAIAADGGFSTAQERDLVRTLLASIEEYDNRGRTIGDAEAFVALLDAADQVARKHGLDSATRTSGDLQVILDDEYRMPRAQREGGALPLRYLKVWEESYDVRVPEERRREAEVLFEEWVREGSVLASSLKSRFGEYGEAALDGRWGGEKHGNHDYTRARLQLRLEMARLQARIEERLTLLLDPMRAERFRSARSELVLRFIVRGPE